MYAVVRTGGKQYRLAEGQTVKIEKIEGEAGASVQLNDVLLVADGDNIVVGTPSVSGAVVNATVVSQGRYRKVEILKFRRRKHHMKRAGHRQAYTEIKVTGITH